MSPTLALPGTDAHVLVTTREDGDAGSWRSTRQGDRAVTGGPWGLLATAPRAFAERPWTFVRQVHGDRVLVVDGPSGPCDEEADALVTTSSAACVAVLGADCALVGLASADGVVGVAHAGWRGLVAGVLPNAVATMRALGASSIVAVLGPCIGPECYPFGSSELNLVASVLGDSVRATTVSGAPALDVAAGVRASLERVEVPIVVELGGCTACDDRWYSYRARRDTARHALALLRDAGMPAS